LLLEIIEKLDNKLINKWPATMLADSRMDRVIGRIKFLTSSIKTMKFISSFGVPNGVIWATIVLIEL